MQTRNKKDAFITLFSLFRKKIIPIVLKSPKMNFHLPLSRLTKGPACGFHSSFVSGGAMLLCSGPEVHYTEISTERCEHQRIKNLSPQKREQGASLSQQRGQCSSHSAQSRGRQSPKRPTSASIPFPEEWRKKKVKPTRLWRKCSMFRNTGGGTRKLYKWGEKTRDPTSRETLEYLQHRRLGQFPSLSCRPGFLD